MHYKLIVNQPFQSTASVLAAAFRFVCAYDPHLLRLEEHWRVIPNGIAIHDSFNNIDIPIGRDASLEEYDSDDFHFFTDGYANTDSWRISLKATWMTSWRYSMTTTGPIILR